MDLHINEYVIFLDLNYLMIRPPLLLLSYSPIDLLVVQDGFEPSTFCVSDRLSKPTEILDYFEKFKLIIYFYIYFFYISNNLMHIF